MVRFDAKIKENSLICNNSFQIDNIDGAYLIQFVPNNGVLAAGTTVIWTKMGVKQYRWKRGGPQFYLFVA